MTKHTRADGDALDVLDGTLHLVLDQTFYCEVRQPEMLPDGLAVDGDLPGQVLGEDQPRLFPLHDEHQGQRDRLVFVVHEGHIVNFKLDAYLRCRKSRDSTQSHV